MKAMVQEQLKWMMPQQNSEGLYIDQSGEVIKFRFLYVKDCSIPVGVGFDSQPAMCPHCGAEGKYVYYWIENGQKRGAMAGCFAKIMRGIDLGEVNNEIIKARAKEAKKEQLSGWDKTILRMDSFIQEGKYDKSWCESKIKDVILDKSNFMKKKYGIRI